MTPEKKADVEKFYKKLVQAEGKSLDFDKLIKYFIRYPELKVILLYFVHTDLFIIKFLCRQAKIKMTEYMRKFLIHAKIQVLHGHIET